MENLDPEHEAKTGKLNSRKKIQSKNLSLRNKFILQKQDSQSSIGEPEDCVDCSKANENFGFSSNSASTSSRTISNNVNLTENNDSLCDFRSPIKIDEINDSLEDFRIKPTVLKANKRPPHKQSKPVVNKKRRNRDIAINLNQPSIESSFFKPQTAVKTAFLCPLCLKSYKDATGQRNHMKSCAARNKISTNKLLDAVELQEKQANERKAMGLLAAPPVQPKKNISRKLISEKDPQLQLALALSMSLHEAQVTEEIEEAHLLAGEPCLPISSEMTEERRKTLQNFGFTTNKPMTASTGGRSRKKRPTGPTLLQTRTQEERDRLLTVRIAEVLMEDEAVTQVLLEKVEEVMKSEENVQLKSQLLRSYHCVEDRLWDKTQQCLTGQSQFPGILLEVSSSKVIPEPETKESEQGSSKLESSNQGENKAPDIVNQNSIPAPIELKLAPGISVIENQKAKIVKHNKTDVNSALNLSTDWRCLLGSSYMSDVLIIAKGKVEIHAHQVVFWARCNEILQDMTKYDSERSWEIQQRILWLETDTLSAYAFLEYIYCGVIDRWVSVFDHSDMLAGIRVLTRKYRLKKLFAYLKDKSEELKLEVRRSLEGNRSKDGSNLSSDEKAENSISSVETDINSVSTVCNDLTSNKSNFEEQFSDSDNVKRKNSKSIDLEESGNVSNNLVVVDCFSSSNDSFLTQTLATSSSIKNRNEKLSGKRSIIKGNTLSLRQINSNGHIENGNNIEPINQTLEDDHCTSPDIFDDTVATTSVYTDTVPNKGRCDADQNQSCSDRDIEFVSECSTNLQYPTESTDLNETSDKKGYISQENNSEKSEQSKVDYSFISTRYRGRGAKPVLGIVGSLNLESEKFVQETEVSGSPSKKKGNITLAIEKMQRLNAKTASESDSECESVESFEIKKYKNPFRINVTDTSSMIEEVVKSDVDFGLNNEIPSRRRNKLSIFEKKIELQAAKNPAMFNLTTFKPESDSYSRKKEFSDSLKSRNNSSYSTNPEFNQQKQIEAEIEDRIEPSQRRPSEPAECTEVFLDLTQESSRESKLDSEEEGEEEDDCNTTLDDKDLSMFTKYKRKHSHNSIDKYRAALKNIISRRLVSGIKDMEESSSSDNLHSSNEESWDRRTKTKRKSSFTSNYEHTDPNQSTSNIDSELSNRISKSGEQIDSSLQILSSTDSDDGPQSPVKMDDVELSDLEIGISDFSSTTACDQLGNSRQDDESQNAFTSKRNTNNKIFHHETGTNSLTNSKLGDTDFSFMKNECGAKKTNISDQDTDTECFIESIMHSKESKSVDKNNKWSDIYEEKSSDIYNEETDPGEMEDKYHQPRNSNIEPYNVSKEAAMLQQSQDGDRSEISSPDCEISGIFSPPSMSIDFVSHDGGGRDNLLDESDASSDRFRNSRMKLHNSTPQATTSNSLSSASMSRIPKDINGINLLNGISDSEFDNIEFTVDRGSANSSCNNKLANAKSVEAGKGIRTTNKNEDEEYCVLESDSSNSGSYKIKKKNRASISVANKSIGIRKRSIESRRRSITPEKSSKSSLRSFKVKSVSENVIQTKRKSGNNFMDDSFDREFARVLTPPLESRNTGSNNGQITPQQKAPSENVTPLANYSAMKTPELRKELQKYGLKAQKRHRAKQLLRHIYNELHPLVPVGDKNITKYSNDSSSEDERPPPKRLNRSNSFETINGRKNTDNIESDCETLASDIRTLSDASNDNEDLENNDLYTLSQSGNSDGLENIFRKLIEADRSLHNKILAYEPIILEDLHSTLKAQGLKCKVNALMDFLDEQCITFRTLANAKKNRTRRKASPKKNQCTQ